jgi:UDP:flavonoid glycosyltransferase YjiC (YdhE family)
VAPLDWGLGHATRCIPIIYALINAGAHVFLAGDDAIAIILKKEFPHLPFLPLKGYQIRYARGNKGLMVALLSQLPRIMRIKNSEHLWLKKAVASYNIQAVISDNRFGLYLRGIPCVYITHQLHIETGSNFLNTIARKIHYNIIQKFSECWVPDTAMPANLAGLLSHPAKLPSVPVKYLGVLSRFRFKPLAKNKPLVLVLSGPEPQRSIFEKQLLIQLSEFVIPTVLVRGLPGSNKHPITPAHITVYNYLPALQLNELCQHADIILARAGYSTIMDLVTIKAKALLVPTPGQHEQLYLAEYLKKKGIFYSCYQPNFNLKKELARAGNFYKAAIPEFELLNVSIIQKWLDALKQSLAS